MHLLRYFHEITARKCRFIQIACAGLLALACLSACGQNTTEPRLTPQSLGQGLALLDDVKRTETMLHPEVISHFGLTHDPSAMSHARLTDVSQAAYERQRLLYISLLERVSSFPPLPSDHPVRRDLLITYDTLKRLTALQNINSGPSNLSAARPYTIDPFRGVWIEAPNLLLNDHTLNTAQDAADYLARLRHLADALEDTSRRLKADAKVGSLAPVSLITATKTEIDSLVAPNDARLNNMIATYATIIDSIEDLPPQRAAILAREASAILRDRIRPAYARLSETLNTVTKDARAQGGLWASPNGDALYKAFLNWYLSDINAPSSLHTAALEDVARRAGELENIYFSIGIDAETPTARYEALIMRQAEAAPDPKVLPNEPQLERQSRIRTSPIAPFQASRPHLYSSRFNGSRPLQITATPQMLDLWPDLIEPALETRALAYNPLAYDSSAPQMRALLRDDAYRATLQSYIAHETHLASPKDEAANIAWHTLRLLEAAMAVADTGLHHDRWTLEQTQAYLQQTIGLPADFTRQITLEIAADPARAASHMAAYRRLLALQNRTRAVLGNRYREADFQKIIMQYGPRPFTMIETDVERWYEAALTQTQ